MALFDSRWGVRTDTGSGRLELLVFGHPLVALGPDTLAEGTPLTYENGVLVAGREADSATRRALLELHGHDTVSLQVALTRPDVRMAVGGWPIIVRDSAVTRAADSAGTSFAPVRHPRTAVGLARNGRDLIFVVVDGRQTPYSDGMTLRELAELFRAFGASQVLNLDGGGSSTFVLADSTAPNGLRIMNRPSDKMERAVANALAIVQGCRERPGNR